MNVYINVPYSEKEQAKLLGARWDSVIRRWYYTDRQDALLFEKWFDKSAPVVTVMAPKGKITLKEFVKQVYGNAHVSLTAKAAKAFGIPYPLRAGWLQTYGDRLAFIDRLVFKKKSKKKVYANGGHPAENSAQSQIEDRVSFNSMTPANVVNHGSNLSSAYKSTTYKGRPLKGLPLNFITSKMPSKLSASRSTHDVESSQCDSQDKGKISCICNVEPWEDCEHTDAMANKAFLSMIN